MRGSVPCDNVVEFECAEEQMTAMPSRVVREIHPTGIIREVKVELHRDHVRYAVETLIDGVHWDVEVASNGEVFRNRLD